MTKSALNGTMESGSSPPSLPWLDESPRLVQVRDKIDQASTHRFAAMVLGGLLFWGGGPGLPATSPVGPRPAEVGSGPLLRIDLNEASWEELALLPDVGPITARRIVAYRVKHGRFADGYAVQEVPGIGPKTYAKMRPYLEPSKR